jgi:hypothetical protein
MTNETAQLTTNNNSINDSPICDQSVDEVTNVASQQPISFVPTPDELAVLAKHWVNEAINDEYFIFWGQCFGLSDLDQIDSDWGRVNEIGKMLGHEATRTAIEEAYSQAAQDYDRNHWIVFRYGKHEERAAYQEVVKQCCEESQDGLADRLASQVVKRIFREGTAEQQTSLLQEELKRYSTKLNHFKTGPHHIVEIFGIHFPAEVKRLVSSIGIEDPEPNPRDNTFFKTLTLEQGKLILAALDETAQKGEGALQELVSVNTKSTVVCLPIAIARQGISGSEVKSIA